MTRRNTLVLASLGAVLVAAPFIMATKGQAGSLPDAVLDAHIVFLGEQHDNPAHHAVQADWVSKLKPTSIVFEMLTPQQAAQATPENRGNEAALEMALGWEAGGWPDFSMYYPIFSAAPEASILGAGVPRDRIMAVMQEDLASLVGAEVAARFELDQSLAAVEQTAREALQRTAHCDALPESMLPGMVNVQRLRDTALAQAALDGLERFGPPVVVITGNGHAREDWGAPFLLRKAAPEIAVFSLGQGEAGQAPAGGFGAIEDGPSVERGDPCDAFK